MIAASDGGCRVFVCDTVEASLEIGSADGDAAFILPCHGRTQTIQIRLDLLGVNPEVEQPPHKILSELRFDGEGIAPDPALARRLPGLVRLGMDRKEPALGDDARHPGDGGDEPDVFDREGVLLFLKVKESRGSDSRDIGMLALVRWRLGRDSEVGGNQWVCRPIKQPSGQAMMLRNGQLLPCREGLHFQINRRSPHKIGKNDFFSRKGILGRRPPDFRN